MARKQNTPRIIEAEQFVLQDAKGRARATLMIRDEFPVFNLMDAEGVSQIFIRLGPDGRALFRLESSGGASIGMSVDNEGNVGVGFCRAGGMPTFDVGCRFDEELRLVVYNKEGSPVWQSVPAHRADSPPSEQPSSSS